MKKYKIQCLIGPLFKVFEVVFELLVPLIIKNIIDKGIGNNDPSYVKQSVILLIVFAIVGFSCTLLAQYMSAYSAINICSDMREDTFSKVLSFRSKDIDKLGTSRLLTTLTSDINQIQVGINLALRLLLRSPFVVLGAVIMAFTIDMKISLLYVAVVAMLAVIIALNFRRSLPAYKAVRSELDNVVTETDDGLNGVRVIRGFTQTDNETKNFKFHTDKLNKLQRASAKITTILNPLTFLIVNLFLCILIYTGAIEFGNGNLSQGEIIALYNYMGQILVELIKLTNLIVQISRALACSNRVSSVIETPVSPVIDTYGASEELLNFNKVSFSYNDDDSYALKDISFSLRKGESIGIIGKTGSGKSTLGALIARSYMPSEGEITYAGGIPPKIGYTMQKTRLFSGTVEYNIKLDREDITSEAVDLAIDVSCAEDFVKSKDMELTESGKNLSGGQRQRLNIARAVASKPQILILDDASASLDAITENNLIEKINSMTEMSKVIISQKIKSVKNCDKIIVLDEGSIVDCGDHETLLKNSDIYREMYALQTKEATV
ncbi:MAG: ABC transporter ATP-binding protein/permease [Clostridia bacterium]|nr:ABC transporter ATP-binding protein/permease [Clostridia bacterium]